MDKAAASALGLDFGTTNSVVALADGKGGTELVAFGDAGDAVFRSALCFWEEERGWNGIAHEAGPWAIEEYLQSPLDSRFIQSFKSVAASPLRSEEHTSELQSLMRSSYAVFCLKKKKKNQT